MSFRLSVLSLGLAAAGLLSPVAAQQRTAHVGSAASAPAATSFGADVLRNYDPTAEQVIFTVTGGGFVYGTNSYDDRGKFQCFDAPSGPIQIQSVTLHMVRGAGAPDMGYSLVLSEGAPGYDGEGGGPGATLYSQDFDTTGLTATAAPAQPVEHALTTPQTVSTSFCVGVQWGGGEAATSLGMAAEILDPAADESPYDWELWNDASWHNMNQTWGNAENPFRAVMWVDVNYVSMNSSADEGPAAAARVRVAPNPANSAATIRFTSATAQRVAIDVLNVLGQRVASLPAVAVGAGEQEFALPVSGLAPGAYLVRVQGESFTAVRQISVVR